MTFEICSVGDIARLPLMPNPLNTLGISTQVIPTIGKRVGQSTPHANSRLSGTSESPTQSVHTASIPTKRTVPTSSIMPNVKLIGHAYKKNHGPSAGIAADRCLNNLIVSTRIHLNAPMRTSSPRYPGYTSLPPTSTACGSKLQRDTPHHVTESISSSTRPFPHNTKSHFALSSSRPVRVSSPLPLSHGQFAYITSDRSVKVRRSMSPFGSTKDRIPSSAPSISPGPWQYNSHSVFYKLRGAARPETHSAPEVDTSSPDRDEYKVSPMTIPSLKTAISAASFGSASERFEVSPRRLRIGLSSREFDGRPQQIYRPTGRLRLGRLPPAGNKEYARGLRRRKDRNRFYNTERAFLYRITKPLHVPGEREAFLSSTPNGRGGN